MKAVSFRAGVGSSLALVLVSALAGCAPVTEALQGMTNTMAQINQGLAAGTPGPGSQALGQSNAQAQAAQAVDKLARSDTANGALIAEARPAIERVSAAAACLNGSTGQMEPLTRYAAPGARVCNEAAPMTGMNYHNRAQCLDVQRIGNFSVKAKNAVSYSVIFVAADSGESSTRSFTLKKDQGDWLLFDCGY